MARPDRDGAFSEQEPRARSAAGAADDFDDRDKRRPRDKKPRSSMMPLFIILGLALGIPALAGLVVVVLVFLGAFVTFRAAKEVVNEADKNIQQAVKEAERDQARLRADALARQKEIERQQQKFIDDAARDQQRQIDAMLARQKELADAIKNKKKAIPVVLPPLEKIPGTNQIDLIGLIDPPRDGGGRRWEIINNELHCKDIGAVPRVEIPYQPPAEYDFIVAFSQPNLRNGISLIMPKPQGGASYFWHIGSGDFGTPGCRYGFGAQPNGVEAKLAGLIKPNTMYTTVVQVRRDRLRATLDGKELMNFQTDFAKLETDNWRTMRDPTVLGVACDDPTVFHQIRVVEITGAGKRVR